MSGEVIIESYADLHPEAAAAAEIVEHEPRTDAGKASDDEKAEDQKGDAAAPDTDGDDAAEDSEKSGEGDGESDDDDEPKHRKPRVQKRINELVKERELAKQEAQRKADEAEYWRRKAMEAAPQPGGPKQPGVTPPQVAGGAGPEPKLEDFATLEEWNKAVVGWQLDAKLAAFKAEREAETRTAREEAQRAALVQSAAQRADAARAELADFDDVVGGLMDTVRIPDEVAVQVLQSPMSAEVLYHLGQDLDAASRLARMSPYQAAREIGKIEARLEAKAEAKKAKPKPQTSAAPAPVKPVAAASSARVWKVDDKDIPMDEYVKLRAQQRKKR